MINTTLVSIYKAIIPRFFTERISRLRDSGGRNTLRKEILNYYKTNSDKVNDEIRECLVYLHKYSLNTFPYDFINEYKKNEINVFKDLENGLLYVIHNGKRMYFKRSWSAKDIQLSYQALLIEQDHRSPHRYLTNQFNVENNSIVADVGAAEGIFSLSIIDKVNKIILFETDLEWIEALNATFYPWKEKVEIINRFVSNKNDDFNISLDEISLLRKITFDFIKIDVDGGEFSLLLGSYNILSGDKKPRIAICTYHNSGDECLFRDHLLQFGIASEPSTGYMIFLYGGPVLPPYFRRGLLRAM